MMPQAQRAPKGMRRRGGAAGEELPQGDHPAETDSEENDMVPPRQKHMTPEMAAEIRAEAEKRRPLPLRRRREV